MVAPLMPSWFEIALCGFAIVAALATIVYALVLVFADLDDEFP